VINKIEAVAKITPPPIPTIREIDDEDIDDEGLFVPVIICPTPKNTMGVNVKDWDEPTKIQGIRYPEPNSFVSVDNEPEILNLEEIKQKIGYPSVAKDLEIEGTVIAKVLVDNTGKYIRHVFESSADKYLTKAVNNELPYLKFKPATKDGVPVAYWLTIPFKFVL
jgi:TonB family protein